MDPYGEFSKLGSLLPFIFYLGTWTLRVRLYGLGAPFGGPFK